MKTSLNFILPISTLLIFQWIGCKTDNLVEIKNISPISINTCESFSGENWLIKNDSTYRAIFAAQDTLEGCESYDLPEIDFSAQSLLGQRTVFKACNPYFFYEVSVDSRTKTYFYSVFATKDETCELIDSIHWILLPAIPENFTVEFLQQVN
ncbi:MAG: hypothetical protein R2798_08160 [Chitinophagales bacterium]|nr:hypothetical protein [Bacteroidota bacterium]MCB9042408.1 hypothetical protein [Chitinophagales bacterium]